MYQQIKRLKLKLKKEFYKPNLIIFILNKHHLNKHNLTKFHFNKHNLTIFNFNSFH